MSLSSAESVLMK